MTANNRWLSLFILTIGCAGSRPAVTPDDAFAAASVRIDALIAEADALKRPDPPALPPMPVIGDTVTFWHYAHPVISRVFEDGAVQVEGATVEAQYIGEWSSAIQKLMVAFATDDLPDIGMVKRDLVAKLYESHRIRPLDTILPKQFLDDLRPEVIADYTYDGHLVALPADGFCSLLYFNKRSVGLTPPKTWAFFTAYVNAQRTTPGPPFPRGLGAFPFLEALWSVDGDVLVGGACGLDRPEARRALAFVMEATRNSLGSEESAFSQWVTGEIAMTVASSRHVRKAAESGVTFGLAPVPGETGPISRRSNDAVVVFSREVGADAAAIAAFVDWLTGPQVLGERAANEGSVPLRRSTGQFESANPEIAESYVAARNTPLHPNWGAIEVETERALSEAHKAAAAEDRLPK